MNKRNRRLSKRQIAGLRRAAEKLIDPEFSRRCSCTQVALSTDDDTVEIYADAVGVSNGYPGISMYFEDFTDFEAQLARSLAVLMFIESNR